MERSNPFFLLVTHTYTYIHISVVVPEILTCSLKHPSSFIRGRFETVKGISRDFRLARWLAIKILLISRGGSLCKQGASGMGARRVLTRRRLFVIIIFVSTRDRSRLVDPGIVSNTIVGA